MFSLGDSPLVTGSSSNFNLKNDLMVTKHLLLNIFKHTADSFAEECSHSHEESKRRQKILENLSKDLERCNINKSRVCKEIKKPRLPEIKIDHETPPKERKEHKKSTKRSLSSEVFCQSKEKIRKDEDKSLSTTKDNTFVEVKSKNKHETEKFLPSIDKISHESRATLADDYKLDWKDNKSSLLNKKEERIEDNEKYRDEGSISESKDQEISTSVIYKHIEGNPEEPEVEAKPEKSRTSSFMSKLGLLKTKTVQFLYSHKQIISGLTIFVLLSFVWYFTYHHKSKRCTHFRFCIPHSIGNKRKFF